MNSITTTTSENMTGTLELEKIVTEEVSNVYISTADTVINCFLVHFIVLVGVIGNAITLIILSDRVVKDTTNIILLSMAACDILFLVNLSVRKCDCILARFDPVLAEIYYPYAISYVSRPGRWAEFIAFTHSVVISCERFLSVLFPLKVSRWVTRRTVMTVLSCVYAAWTLYIIPYAIFKHEIEWSFNKLYNRTLPIARETKWFRENRLVLETISEIVLTAVAFLFSFVIAANSCAIAYRLNRLSKERINMSTAKTDVGRINIKASRMLLVVCIVFNLCNLPGNVIYIYFYVDPSLRSQYKLHALLSDIEELFLSINSASNFFIYVLMSAKFYKSVVDLIGCRAPSRHSLAKVNKRQ